MGGGQVASCGSPHDARVDVAPPPPPTATTSQQAPLALTAAPRTTLLSLPPPPVAGERPRGACAPQGVRGGGGAQQPAAGSHSPRLNGELHLLMRVLMLPLPLPPVRRALQWAQRQGSVPNALLVGHVVMPDAV
jgi:hypothetical protein